MLFLILYTELQKSKNMSTLYTAKVKHSKFAFTKLHDVALRLISANSWNSLPKIRLGNAGAWSSHIMLETY